MQIVEFYRNPIILLPHRSDTGVVVQSFIILPERLRRTIRQDHSMDETALHMFNLAKSYEPFI